MYRDTIIEKYIELIKSKLNGEIKYFYQGDPVKIPASNLPCCIIAKSQTRVAQVTNAEDGHEIGLTITIVADIRNDLSTDNNIASIVPGVATLYKLVEERDANYKLTPTSLLGILRNNQLLDPLNNLRTDLSSMTRIDYGENLRQRNPEEWSIEARIEIVANFIQIR